MTMDPIAANRERQDKLDAGLKALRRLRALVREHALTERDGLLSLDVIERALTVADPTPRRIPRPLLLNGHLTALDGDRQW